VILVLLHQMPSIHRGFASPNPHDLQILVGFRFPKVFSRILQDFFILHRSLSMNDFMCLVVPLGYLSPNLSLV
jgi:hypothetical protein